MKKIDAVFSLLIEEIKKISDDADEAFWTGLAQAERDSFDAICDELMSLKAELEKSRDSVGSHVDFLKLKSVFERFNDLFPRYPSFSLSKVLYQIAVSAKICSMVGRIPDEEVDPQFDFFSCSLKFPSAAFASNVTPLNSNLIWFNPSIVESLDALVLYETNLELWYCLAAFSGSIDFSLATEILVCPAACLAGKGNVLSLLKIYMLASGKKVTRTIEYSKLPKNSSINNYDPQFNYAQFGEVVQIMGEYVDRKDVLSKYLSIYHVIESFMFKYPIVKLERSRNGVMFSIRDFKSLYKAVETREQEAVTALVKGAFALPFNGISLGEEIYKLWTAFLVAQAANLGDIDDFFTRMDVSRAQVNNINSFVSFFSSVLYRIRCSVVHNKETEYHISSENYSEGCRLVLEEFYLPALEELVFLLLSKENDVVWYKSDSIALWNKTA
ncbi:hypothetical protein [Pseudomonas fluorescens]|uniref:hypothetical protein n=1 Tax=Pseudomonas fluorescens TaxID=294 RepID=UPI00124971B5|nr:hypothetical protein [Pseudomonas fluorescens]CAG8872811.1 hypothetical protein PS861_05326 [Pseudomonas fluorescens]